MIAAVNNVVAIHGVPRSGTSWLGQLFNSNEHVAYRYQPFFSYAFRGRIDANSDASALQGFFRSLLESEDDFLLQRGAGRLATEGPTFKKEDTTHLVYKEVRFHDLLPHLLATLPELKAVGLVRDPRAVLASWARAPREFDPNWAFEEEWRHAHRKNAGLRENWYGFERWKRLTESFLSLEAAFPNRFHLLRYEELVGDPDRVLRRLFEALGLGELGSQSQQFINDSTSRNDGDTYGVFRRSPVNPKRVLSRYPAVAAAIADELRDTPLSRFISE